MCRPLIRTYKVWHIAADPHISPFDVGDALNLCLPIFEFAINHSLDHAFHNELAHSVVTKLSTVLTGVLRCVNSFSYANHTSNLSGSITPNVSYFCFQFVSPAEYSLGDCIITMGNFPALHRACV